MMPLTDLPSNNPVFKDWLMTHECLLVLPVLWLMMTQAPTVSLAPASLNSDLCDIMVDSVSTPAVGVHIYY